MRIHLFPTRPLAAALSASPSHAAQATPPRRALQLAPVSNEIKRLISQIEQSKQREAASRPPEPSAIQTNLEKAANQRAEIERALRL